MAVVGGLIDCRTPGLASCQSSQYPRLASLTKRQGVLGGPLAGAGDTALGMGVTGTDVPGVDIAGGADGAGLALGDCGTGFCPLPAGSAASAGNTMGGGAGGLGSTGTTWLGGGGASEALGMSNKPAPTATANKTIHMKPLDRDSLSVPSLDKLCGGGGSMSAVATATCVMTDDRSAPAGPGVWAVWFGAPTGFRFASVDSLDAATGLIGSAAVWVCTYALSGGKPSKVAIFRAAVALTESL